MDNAKALIYKKGVLAASLEKTGNGLAFSYTTDYLQSGGPAVATTLPLTDQPTVLPGATSPAYFAGLLPEGRRLTAIRTRIKTSADNDLALLLEIGQDLIGDVQVLPEGILPDADREALQLPSDTSALNFNQIRDQYFGLRATGIPGVQDKVSGKMLHARSKTANEDFIVKFNPIDVPFAIENEFFFLNLAKKCDISTSKYALLTDAEGNHALRLERFDRVRTNGVTSRLAMEDGCQVLGLYPANKYDVDFVEMGQKLRSLCSAMSAAGYNLFKQLVFAWLTGNGDAHAKNFSVLEASTGDFAIAPAYDLLCTAFYNGDRQMALPIDGKTFGWNRATLLGAAAQLHVPEKAAIGVIEKQLQTLAGLPDAITDGALPFARHLNLEMAKVLKKRAKSISA